MDILSLDPAKECHQLNAKERRRIMLLMKDFRFKVTGCRSFKEAIITAGGVDTREIDQSTMESKKIANLYFAGEVLDVDADTGGYNLQIAWSTGWLAGRSAAGNVIGGRAIDYALSADIESRFYTIGTTRHDPARITAAFPSHVKVFKTGTSPVLFTKDLYGC